MSSKTKTTVAKTTGKRVAVPKLRFPKFRSSGAWTTETLGTVAIISTEKVGNNTCIPMSITSGVGLVSQMEKFGRIIAGNSYTNYLLLKKNDFAYNKSATKEYPEGFIAMYSGDDLAAVPNSIFTCFRIKGDSPVPAYLNYLLLGNLHGKWLRNFIEVGARAHGSLSIDDDDLLALPIPVPSGNTSPEEQKKIAECLISVDELIAAQAQKLDALKTHKKGLMQQLFPREGETQPRLRLPEFRNAGDWEVKKLEDIGRVIRGASPRPKGDSRYYGGPVPRLMVQDVTRDGKWVTPQIDSLTEVGAQLSRPCPAGTLTIVCSGAVGVVSFLAVDACIHDGFLALVDIDESIATKDFLFHTLSTLRSQFEKGATHGGVFTNLTTTGIDLFEIQRPSISEQQRIADFLTGLDDLITAQSQKHDALKTHKKGLMQQLFPCSTDVKP